MNAEMNMYDIQIKEYKAEIEKLTAELNDVKRAYFEKKRLEQSKNRRPVKETLVANTNPKANSGGLDGAEMTFKASGMATLEANGYWLEEVHNFKYLGAKLVPNGQCKDGIASRIDAARRVFSSLRKCL
ncbi:unnamed protein product [Dibothriocephalus latus]|uniref:Uncharacterized protein n=1 Tax=Dibothriocephalus latus TaxID=60516 RepID=A0A3P6PTI4_DIBLA|nr:unnamed protein product [Dibothriocephalus latus]